MEFARVFHPEPISPHALSNSPTKKKKASGGLLAGGVSRLGRSQVMSARIEQGCSAALMALGRRRLDAGRVPNKEALLSCVQSGEFHYAFLAGTVANANNRVWVIAEREQPRGLEAEKNSHNLSGLMASDAAEG